MSDSLDYENFAVIGSSAESVQLSTKLYKINKRNKKQERILLITNISVYNIKLGSISNSMTWKRQIHLKDIHAILISRSSSTQFTIHVPSQYDYRFQTFDGYRRKQIIDTILHLHKKTASFKLNIYQIDTLCKLPSYIVLKADKQQKRVQKIESIKKLVPLQPVHQIVSNKQHFVKLVNGFTRPLSASTPYEIKSIIISFLYQFLVYNEYCKAHIHSTDTLYQNMVYVKPRTLSSAQFIDDQFVRYGGRIASKIPINKTGSFNNHILINIMHSLRNSKFCDSFGVTTNPELFVLLNDCNPFRSKLIKSSIFYENNTFYKLRNGEQYYEERNYNNLDQCNVIIDIAMYLNHIRISKKSTNEDDENENKNIAIFDSYTFEPSDDYYFVMAFTPNTNKRFQIHGDFI